MGKQPDSFSKANLMAQLAKDNRRKLERQRHHSQDTQQRLRLRLKGAKGNKAEANLKLQLAFEDQEEEGVSTTAASSCSRCPSLTYDPLLKLCSKKHENLGIRDIRQSISSGSIQQYLAVPVAHARPVAEALHHRYWQLENTCTLQQMRLCPGHAPLCGALGFRVYQLAFTSTWAICCLEAAAGSDRHRRRWVLRNSERESFKDRHRKRRKRAHWQVAAVGVG